MAVASDKYIFPADMLSYTEKQWQQSVMDAAHQLGWIAVHFRQMVGNPIGWPDLILIRGEKTIFAELKSERGKLGPKQQEWIARLTDIGADVRIWRPSDYDGVLAVLSAGVGELQ